MEGSVEEARNLFTLLDLIANFSSLQINWAKSAFVGFGLTQEERMQCSDAFGTLIESLPMRYLGLPLQNGKLRRIEWQPVIEKVETRLGVARKAFVKGWEIGIAPFNTYINPHFLPIYFQTAYSRWEETRTLDETIHV